MKALRLGSLSNLFLKILTVSADLVIWQSPFHTGTTLMLNVFFIFLVLLYLTNNLCSECLVTLVTALMKKSLQFTSSNPLIMNSNNRTWNVIHIFLCKYTRKNVFNTLALSLSETQSYPASSFKVLIP